MKKLILAALVGAALAAGGLLGKAKLDKDASLAALNSINPEYASASQESPICLVQRDGGEAYVILESDAQAGVYRGVRILVMLQLPFQLAARDLNDRVDLRKVDCELGL